MPWYDIFEDWSYIEASFAEQYGIRLRHEQYMPWTEFSSLLSAVGHKTPLGQLISIRSEDDRDTLKHFTPEQRKMRADWRTSQAKKNVENNPDHERQRIENLQRTLKEAFS